MYTNSIYFFFFKRKVNDVKIKNGNPFPIL